MSLFARKKMSTVCAYVMKAVGNCAKKFLSYFWVMCILTSFWVLRAPECWLNYFFQLLSTFFVPFKPFSVFSDVFVDFRREITEKF